MGQVTFEEKKYQIVSELIEEYSNDESFTLEDCIKLIVELNRKIEVIENSIDKRKEAIKLLLRNYRYNKHIQNDDKCTVLDHQIRNYIDALNKVQHPEYDLYINELEFLEEIRDKLNAEDLEGNIGYGAL